MSGRDIAFCKSAFLFAKNAHVGQKRASGEDYIIHPFRVALYLADYKFPKEVITAGLLHDVLEDTKVTLNQLIKKFGKTVANLVDGVSVIGTIQNKANLDLKDNEERQYMRLQKLILASASDIRVIFIRLFDRKHNLETLKVFNTSKRQRKAKETLEVYAPLAKKLGMGELASQLEDLSFAYLEPKIYRSVLKIRNDFSPADLKLLALISQKIKLELKKNSIKTVKIDYRLKHIYSLYNKLKRSEMNIGQIYDLAALRVILNTKSDCYKALGIIHSLYQPMAGRIKDYIANPKPNGYQSLHTTVFIKGEKPIEIQIRTLSIHHFAEHGLASHWLYKEKAKHDKLKQWFFHLNELTQKKRYNLAQIFSENIYVFTPKGEIIELLNGATALDFAYAIHSEIGHKTRYVLVNSRIRPLDFKLRNSDIVEIKTAKNALVSPLWLKKVETNEAKNKIKIFLRNKNKDFKIKKARQEFSKQLIFYGFKFNFWENKKDFYLKKLKQSNEENFWLDIYEGNLNIDQIIHRFFMPVTDQASKKIEKNIDRVIVAGEKNLKIKLAKCCQPKNFDSVIGYISNLKVIVVHKNTCPNLVRCDKTRLVGAWWEGEKTDLLIEATNRIGLLFDLMSVFKNKKINILDLQTLENEGRHAKIRVAISQGNMLNWSELAKDLGKVTGVKKVIFSK